MEEEKQILYCFKFDDITGEIQRVVIDSYSTRQLNSWGKILYSFKVKDIAGGSKTSVVNEKFDRFVSNKVYTFIDDKDRAKKIINDKLKKNIDEYQHYLSRQIYLLNKLNIRAEAKSE